MNMSGAKITSTLLKLLILGSAALFTVQNLNRSSDLTLDLWVVGFQTTEPTPVPLLLWSALVTGLAIGIGWGIQSRRQAVRRIRQLEADLVRMELGRAPAPSKDDDWA